MSCTLIVKFSVHKAIQQTPNVSATNLTLATLQANQSDSRRSNRVNFPNDFLYHDDNTINIVYIIIIIIIITSHNRADGSAPLGRRVSGNGVLRAGCTK